MVVHGQLRRATAAVAVTLGARRRSRSSPASADNGTDTSALRDAVTVDGHPRPRAGLPGHRRRQRRHPRRRHARLRGVGRVRRGPARATPATTVSRQEFTLRPVHPELERAWSRRRPVRRSTSRTTDFAAMTYSGSGDVTAPVQAVDINLAGDRASTSGCEAADFAGFTPGNIALIQRGTCFFRVKVDNAAAAGAGRGDRVQPGQRRSPTTTASGCSSARSTRRWPPSRRWARPSRSAQSLADDRRAGDAGRRRRHASRRPRPSTCSPTRPAGGPTAPWSSAPTSTRWPKAPASTTTAAARRRSWRRRCRWPSSASTPTNRVRFAFWGGEEDGLIGSDYYVSQLDARGPRSTPSTSTSTWSARRTSSASSTTATARRSASTGPNGSAPVEQVFLDYFASQGLATEPTEFDGRSDYFAFINNGIPAGGLFTGAEGIKTAEQAAIYGGTAGRRLRPVLPPGLRHHRQPEQHGARPDVGRHRPRHVDVRR